ncbi:MAG: hypothetical protein R3B51_11950 [Thermodesulfobacteriota bacterium]
MSKKVVKGSTKSFKGEVTPPAGDKSISHRSLMLGSLARGKTVVTAFNCEDTISTANAMCGPWEPGSR